MSTRDLQPKYKIFEDAIKQSREKHPIRWKWYSLIATLKIKIGLFLYRIAKRIGGWHDDQDWYGDQYREQVQEKYADQAIYCPLVKYVIRKGDCPPCEMCPD